jgi:C1A family cysteine protease
MKTVIALCGLVSMAFSQGAIKAEDTWRELVIPDWNEADHATAFQGWKKEFGKTYPSLEEEAERFSVFLENWEKINTMNQQGKSYKLRLNQFGDLREGDEFRTYVHGHSGSCKMKRGIRERTQMNPVPVSKLVGAIPVSIDWTTQGVVTPVKNQGQCGSCWAFSATGSIESRYAIAHSQLNSLSEQQLVDCSDAYGNMGCNGGLMDYAFKYVMASGGLCTEAEYPYTGVDGSCKASTCGTKYDPIGSYADVTPDNEADLQASVAQGPVSVAIEADQFAFQFYSGGILNGECGTNLDHGVLAVGYGSQDGQDYWKVKNSWGTSWGEEGYVLICRDCNKNGAEGECGIDMEPSYPISK